MTAAPAPGAGGSAGSAAADNPNQRSLADILVEAGVITQKQLNRVKPRIERVPGAPPTGPLDDRDHGQGQQRSDRGQRDR